MADKELRKLKRRELLQMLLVQCEESERLEGELEEFIAEHEAMSESYERLKQKLNGIFEAAQQAADQYLMNVRRLSEAEQGDEKDNRIPFEEAWRAGVRRGTRERGIQV